MTLDSVAHLLPRARAASPDQPALDGFVSLLRAAPPVRSTGSEVVEEPEQSTTAESVVTAGSSRRRVVSRVAVALAASGVFFTGVGSVFMHNAMPMSATMGGQGSHRMADGQAMTAPMTTNNSAAGPASAVTLPAPAEDSGPLRPGAAVSTPPTTAAGTAASHDMSMAQPSTGQSSTAGPATTSSPSTSTASTSTASTSTASTSSASRSGTSASTGSSSGAGTSYVVRSGDDFGSVGARLGISPARLAALNPGVDSSKLTIGQSLRVD